MLKLARVLVIAVVILLISAPVAAAKVQPVGTRLNLLSSTLSFQADTPFHIKQGWEIASDSDWIGRYSFALDVDGAPRTLDFIQRDVIPDDPDLLVRYWGFNFAAGLSGSHTFTGHWFAPCGAVSLCSPGQAPNTVVEALTVSKTVTFS